MPAENRDTKAQCEIDLAEVLPVLPVRNVVLFPNTAVPLVVGRAKSLEAIRRAQDNGGLFLVVAQRDPSKEEPEASDLYRIGVVSHLSKLTQMDKGGYQLIANGLSRFQVEEYFQTPELIGARGERIAESGDPRLPHIQALAAEVKELGKTIITLASVPSGEALTRFISQLEEPSHVADLCCTFLNLSLGAKQALLETLDLESRLNRLLEVMSREKEKLSLQQEIQNKMMGRLSKNQRDQLLREQLRTIHEELGEEGGLHESYSRKIETSGMPEEALKIAREELQRLIIVPRTSPEHHVIRTYLDWLVNMPWSRESALDGTGVKLADARRILDEDHYGVDRVKSRIIEFLAVQKLKKEIRGPILCLQGPPGVGKTSIAKSIARALGRTFIRASLGGVRDEAEIRGHRRTYIGAFPGRLVQSIKRAGVRDPLILLDEIDKMGADFRGDPASALLEALDPEQNSAFTDHYLDVPFDLSRVFFIVTANVIDPIPAALRDRLEIIEMSSYTRLEKREIATRHLLPKLLEEHGILPHQVHLPTESVEAIIDFYTREAGVRQLSRELSRALRAAAVELAKDNPMSRWELLPESMERVLGPKRFFVEVLERKPRPGVVTALAWTPAGGEILPIEVNRFEGRGNLILTGKLGEVMQESARLALTLVRAHLSSVSPIRFERSDFHVHIPSGAIPKDGPSAGLALFLALLSLIENKPIAPEIAFTGELTLRGLVLPVGGIKEKALAAHRAGVKTLCLPKRNQGDLEEIGLEARSGLTFRFVEEYREALVVAGIALKAENRPSKKSPTLELPLSH